MNHGSKVISWKYYVMLEHYLSGFMDANFLTNYSVLVFKSFSQLYLCVLDGMLLTDVVTQHNIDMLDDYYHKSIQVCASLMNNENTALLKY